MRIPAYVRGAVLVVLVATLLTVPFPVGLVLALPMAIATLLAWRYRATLTPLGIEQRVLTRKTRAWSDITEIRYNGRMVFLMTPPRSHISLPVGWFSARNRESLRKALEERAPKAKMRWI